MEPDASPGRCHRGLRTRPGFLSEVNSLMCENNPDSMFVTVFFCIFDPYDGSLVFANAGHPAPLILRAGGTVDTLQTADNVVLGLLPGAGYDLFTASLDPGDLLFLYSDGVTEAMNEDGEEFDVDRLFRALLNQLGRGAKESSLSVVQSVRDFRGHARSVGRYHLPVVAPERVSRFLSPLLTQCAGWLGQLSQQSPCEIGS